MWEQSDTACQYRAKALTDIALPAVSALARGNEWPTEETKAASIFYVLPSFSSPIFVIFVLILSNNPACQFAKRFSQSFAIKLCTSSRSKNEIVTSWQVMLLQPEGLSAEPLDTVPLNRVAMSERNRHPPAHGRGVILIVHRQ